MKTEPEEIHLTLLGQARRKLFCLVLGHRWKPAIENKPMYCLEGKVCARCYKVVWDKVINLP